MTGQEQDAEHALTIVAVLLNVASFVSPVPIVLSAAGFVLALLLTGRAVLRLRDVR